MAARVLIVGGTGVISTAVTGALLAAGHEVTHVNRGLRPLSGPAPTATIRADRMRFAEFEAAMRATGPWDVVYDMVCYRPEEAASAIRAFATRTRCYAFCSTVDVYAKPAANYPVTEDEPHRPVSRYGVLKAACEAVLMEAHRAGSLPVTILRPAYTMGEGARGVLNSLGWDTTFLDRLRKGRPVIVHGDGTGLWTACHADVVATAFAGIVGNDRAPGRAYNTLGDEVMTWDAYVRRVAAAIDAPEPELVHVPTGILLRLQPERGALAAENLQFPNVLANDRAKAELGLRPVVGFETGIARTWASLLARGAVRNCDGDLTDDLMIDAWRRVTAGLDDPLPTPGRAV